MPTVQDLDVVRPKVPPDLPELEPSGNQRDSESRGRPSVQDSVPAARPAMYRRCQSRKEVLKTLTDTCLF
jgi:hypothetical protein